MAAQNSYNNLNFSAYRKEIVSMYTKEKMSLDKVAGIAKTWRGTIEKILDEEKVERRTREESLFKGNKFPTGEELKEDYTVMSTCEMGVKYGRPGKPVSENTICRLMRRHKIPIRERGRKSEVPDPTTEEFQKMMENLTVRQIARKYHRRYEWAAALRDSYGLGRSLGRKTLEKRGEEDEPSTNSKTSPKTQKFQQEVALYDGERVIKLKFLDETPKKVEKKSERKTVRDVYFRHEKDTTIESDQGFER